MSLASTGFWECFPLRGALRWARSTLSTAVCVCLGWGRRARQRIATLPWKALKDEAC